MRRIVDISAKVVEVMGNYCSNTYYALEITFTLHGDGQDGKEAKALLKFPAASYGTVNTFLYWQTGNSITMSDDDDTPFMKEIFGHLAAKIEDEESLEEFYKFKIEDEEDSHKLLSNSILLELDDQVR